MLTVDTYNSGTVTFSISGTLDSPATGLQSGNFFFAPTVDLTTAWYSGSLSLTSSSLNLGGDTTMTELAAVNNGSSTGYSVFFYRAGLNESLPASMSVSGSVTFTGVIDDVNFSASDFNLYNGLVSSRQANVLVASAIPSAIPEPSSVILLSLGALGFAARRRINS
ncbi:MAG: PEP-CTERM sorting domain-containing protein [Akkermansiaceae bacterium]